MSKRKMYTAGDTCQAELQCEVHTYVKLYELLKMINPRAFHLNHFLKLLALYLVALVGYYFP